MRFNPSSHQPSRHAAVTRTLPAFLTVISVIAIFVLSFVGCNESDSVAAPEPDAAAHPVSEDYPWSGDHTDYLSSFYNLKSGRLPHQQVLLDGEGNPLPGHPTFLAGQRLLTGDELLPLKGLSQCKVSTPESARAFARGKGTMSAHVNSRVIGLVRVGQDAPDFAAKGDFVWIVRFSHAGLGSEVNWGVWKEVWVSSTTGKTRSMLGPNVE